MKVITLLNIFGALVIIALIYTIYISYYAGHNVKNVIYGGGYYSTTSQKVIYGGGR